MSQNTIDFMKIFYRPGGMLEKQILKRDKQGYYEGIIDKDTIQRQALPAIIAIGGLYLNESAAVGLAMGLSLLEFYWQCDWINSCKKFKYYYLEDKI